MTEIPSIPNPKYSPMYTIPLSVVRDSMGARPYLPDIYSQRFPRHVAPGGENVGDMYRAQADPMSSLFEATHTCVTSSCRHPSRLKLALIAAYHRNGSHAVPYRGRVVSSPNFGGYGPRILGPPDLPTAAVYTAGGELQRVRRLEARMTG